MSSSAKPNNWNKLFNHTKHGEAVNLIIFSHKKSHRIGGFLLSNREWLGVSLCA